MGENILREHPVLAFLAGGTVSGGTVEPDRTGGGFAGGQTAGQQGRHHTGQHIAAPAPGSPGSIEQYHNIHVVYTKEAETADMFIERVTHEIGKNRRVRVATSDGMEQVIILGHGALRVSARMFHEEVQDVEKEIKRCIQGEA